MSSNKAKKMPVLQMSTTLTPEQEQQFEVELCWCIQQLQTALRMGKLNKKQLQDHTKALNTLMSNSTPFIKKKQVMRLSFGDYREKMAQEEKKAEKKATTIKISNAEPSKKSVFIKKSFNVEDKNFKFNFDTPEPDTGLSENLTNIAIKDDTCSKSNSSTSFHYRPSDNGFRFNFNAAE